MGGGTGTYGSLEWDYSNVQRVVNYDATIFENDSLVPHLAFLEIVTIGRLLLVYYLS